MSKSYSNRDRDRNRRIAELLEKMCTIPCNLNSTNNYLKSCFEKIRNKVLNEYAPDMHGKSLFHKNRIADIRWICEQHKNNTLGGIINMRIKGSKV